MNVVWMKWVILISRRDYKAAADKKNVHLNICVDTKLPVSMATHLKRYCC